MLFIRLRLSRLRLRALRRKVTPLEKGRWRVELAADEQEREGLRRAVELVLARLAKPLAEEKKTEPAKKEAEPAKTQAQENLDAEPEAEPEPPAKQDSQKSNPAPAKQTGRPAPIPVSDDDDF